MCPIRKNVLWRHQLSAVVTPNMRKFFAIHGLLVSVLGLTVLFTGVYASVYAKCTKDYRKKSPNFANDEESIIPDLRPYYHPQQQYHLLCCELFSWWDD